MKNTSIERSAHGYSRGVIFGLTMAEVFLLLIFCLLLVLATLEHKREELVRTSDNLAKANEFLTVSNNNYKKNLEELGQGTSVPEDVFNVVNNLDDNELKWLLDNSEIASKYSSDQLNEAISKAEMWDTLTNQPPKQTFEQLDEIEKNATAAQLARLIQNAEVAMSTEPVILIEQISKAEMWDTLSNQPPKQTFEQLDEIEKNATAAQLARLIENAEVAMSTEPVILIEQIAKAEMWDQQASLSTVEPVGNNWPPIISLPEAENYSFEIGSAQLTENFKTQLSDKIAQQILSTLSKYEADLIEVIGHTDLQPMSRARESNLDTTAKNFFESDGEVRLFAKDNVGLGYARALSVARHLLGTPELQGYTILPYSAAQLITPYGTITTANDDFESSQLRRIEIRVRRQDK